MKLKVKQTAGTYFIEDENGQRIGESGGDYSHGTGYNAANIAAFIGICNAVAEGGTEIYCNNMVGVNWANKRKSGSRATHTFLRRMINVWQDYIQDKEFTAIWEKKVLLTDKVIDMANVHPLNELRAFAIASGIQVIKLHRFAKVDQYADTIRPVFRGSGSSDENEIAQLWYNYLTATHELER